jgi:GT2 family glycosyltransferase
MISLIVVNYRSASLAAAAIRSARATTARDMQVIVVDNSSDPSEAALLRDHADELIISDRNRGYGGAVNDARPRCKGSTLIVANADVVFGAGAIDSLVDAMTGDVAAAGPALYWDDAFSWLLPPSELVTTAEKLDEAIASRSGPWALWRNRARARARIRFWSLTDVTPIPAISGAVMAIRASDFDAVKGFDERFPLYFEETDLLRRLARLRRRIVYVPQSRCRHIYNQSAGSDRERAARLYARSEAEYLEKWSGRTAARLIKALERPTRPVPSPPAEGPIEIPEGDTIVEASPLASFWTAAGHVPTGSRVDVPAEVWEAYRSDVLYLRVLDRLTGRVLANYARYRS